MHDTVTKHSTASICSTVLSHRPWSLVGAINHWRTHVLTMYEKSSTLLQELGKKCCSINNAVTEVSQLFVFDYPTPVVMAHGKYAVIYGSHKPAAGRTVGILPFSSRDSSRWIRGNLAPLLGPSVIVRVVRSRGSNSFSSVVFGIIA